VGKSFKLSISPTPIAKPDADILGDHEDAFSPQSVGDFEIGQQSHCIKCGFDVNVGIKFHFLGSDRGDGGSLTLHTAKAVGFLSG
jgi:hypothetical protein